MKDIRGNRENRIIKNSKGFTLLETLLVVAIIAVLLGISIMGVVAVQKELRQRELDSKAEVIYMAAQNRLMELKASGRAEFYSPDNLNDVHQLGLIPLDSEDENRTEESLFYVTSSMTGTGELSTASVVLPESRVEKEIRDNSWVIEYDPASGSVYAVFYSEDTMEYAPESFNDLRIRQMRKKAGAKVGYYGGDTVVAIDTNTLNPKIEIYNEETLHALLVCNMVSSGDVSFEIKIEDEYKHSVTEKISQKELTRVGANLSYDLVLDKLADEQRFKDKYPNLVAGSDITITLIARSDDDLVDSATVTDKTNSLFAESETDKDIATESVAVITYGRHLQNLDSESGLNSNPGYMNFRKAVQKNNLHFENDEENIDDWYSIYGDKAYKAVSNDSLDSYSGSYSDGSATLKTVIYGLDTQTGMFDVFKGRELKDITLSGARITGGEYAGAVAGSIVSGSGSTAAVSDCQAYLSETEGDLTGRTEKDICISGSKYTGGLVGRTSGNVKITDSLAATVAGTESADYTGGLVGYAAGSLAIESSYADCYLYGKNAGGLIGSADDNCNISITDSYSAGYITAADKAAGFVPEEVKTMKNAYSACAYMENADKVYATVKGISDETTVSKVYYLSTEGLNSTHIGTALNYGQLNGEKAKYAGKLGDKFTASTGGDNTYAYNLMGQGLTDYSFPKLEKLTHYGDWKADFEDSRPVYYEVYDKGTTTSYGIYGANLDTLKKSGSATGDGYGIIYGSKPAAASVVNINGTEVSAGDAVEITAGDDTYWLLKFPSEIVNTKNAPKDFYQELDADGITYYYNPHFAKTVTSEKPNTVSRIYVRTARQLYNMSLYYEDYADKTEKSTYTQELDIYYGKYNWGEYAGINDVTEQKPIGTDSRYEFHSIYDGGSNVIDGVSFASDKYYAGMFGYNRGTLRNIVIASDYGQGTDRYVSTDSNIEGSKAEAYIGVLAGRNSKTIRNCAAAGYTFKIYTYRSSKLYAGGLVGVNSGTVRNSSAETPDMRISETYANVKAGGFAGRNIGGIYSSYSVGKLDIIEAKQGNAAAGGFTGENTGILNNAYCAVSITISGSAKGYGFTPAGGTITGCAYLNNGTYYYVEKLNAYDISGGDNRVKSVNSSELGKLKLKNFGTASKANSLYHGKTNDLENDNRYPYPAIVKKGSDYVHYGNWPVETELGDTGVFYWEHEAGGPNAGYHFRYLGIKDSKGVGGSSLCTAHNDGGIVKEYGYGYYYKEGAKVNVSMTSFAADPVVNDDASDKIASQLSEYEVVAYTTGTDTDTGLYLNTDAANGRWNLRYTENDRTVNYRYTICPFFANSFSCDSIAAADSTGYDGNTDTPGSDSNRYNVRSAEQLQYINWNYSNENTSTFVNGTSAQYNRFPYLIYVGGTSATVKDLNYYWEQSHDIDNDSRSFTPIGSMYYTNNKNDGNAYSAYFGGSYDGKSYSIKNIKIQSDAQMVGMFGITIGARLKNIVMYSENEDTIEITKDSKKWYCIGGLVGFAAKGSSSNNAVIENCTVSGYRIIDSRNTSGDWGGASIGGLAGATNMDISKCTAVNDINIALSYNSGYNNVRVGGLVGNCRAAIDGCYSGGSIESSVTTYGYNHGTSTNIWIGGITGGVVMINYGNLKNLVGSINTDVYVKNSYSYVNLPKSGSHQVRTVHAIASNGEAQSGAFNINDIPNPDVNIVNCYAYEDNVKNSDDYIARGNKNYNETIDIKDGDQSQSHVYLTNSGNSPYVTYEQLSSKTGTIALLNKDSSQFDFVTAFENGAKIDGKYSHPGDDSSLEGTNYPFPTVLTQTNTFGETVNVHYGTWPKGTMYWQDSMSSFDMLENSEIELYLKYLNYRNGDTPEFIFLDEDENRLSEADSPLAFKSCNFVTDSQYYRVVFTALKEGTVTVRAKLGSTTADTLVSITANLVIAAAPAELDLSAGDDGNIFFNVKSASGNVDFTDAVKWDIEVDDETVASCEAPKYSAADKQWKMKVTGLKADETSITARAIYTTEINGVSRSFSETIVILVNVTDDTQSVDNE